MKNLISEGFAAARNFLKFLMLLVIDFLIKTKKSEIRPNTLLLIRLDSIGDYVMFRNFISVLKDDDRYRNYKITLCGNIIWKDLAEFFDMDFVDDFIWVDRLKYLNNILYKYRTMKKVYDSGFEIAIETIHSREILFGDSIIKASNAKIRIGSKVVERYSKLKKNFLSDRFYTKLLPVNNEVMFEFKRTKEFYANLLGYEIELKKPFLNTSAVTLFPEIKNKYIVIFPGAGRKDKMWSTKNFKAIAEFVIKYSYNVVVSGSDAEKEIGNKVRPDKVIEKYLNLCGNSLPQLAKLISDAELLVSNDTSAVHIAVAVNTPFICIANGYYFGRFYPYPRDIYSNGYYFFPVEGSVNSYNINSILPSKVEALVKKILIT